MSLTLRDAARLADAPLPLQRQIRRQLEAAALVDRQAARYATASALAAQHDADPERTRQEAERILRELPADPAAAMHRDELTAEASERYRAAQRAAKLHAAIMGIGDQHRQRRSIPPETYAAIGAKCAERAAEKFAVWLEDLDVLEDRHGSPSLVAQALGVRPQSIAIRLRRHGHVERARAYERRAAQPWDVVDAWRARDRTPERSKAGRKARAIMGGAA